MADEEKRKAEMRAAAKKRAEELKKKKAKKGGGAASKSKDDGPSKPDNAPAVAAEDLASPTSPKSPEAPESAEVPEQDDDQSDKKPLTAAISTSAQSKLRSASFRAGNAPAGPTSPWTEEGSSETAAEIYRKQVGRIEELEKENTRLAKVSADAEKRWQKAEEDLADLREGDAEGGLERLKLEIAALQRQNAQLQSAASSRRAPSMSASNSPHSPSNVAAELQAQLASESSTIETMELELSRLRAQAARQATAGGSDKEQITALEKKLARAEQAASKANCELNDLKRNLERTTEKMVREDSSRTSAETKLRALETEMQTLRTEREELKLQQETLDKKVAALGTLHKENDARTQALRREKESAGNEVTELRVKLQRAEEETTRLRRHDAAECAGTDDAAVDELENEGRSRLEQHIRELEAEVYDLRRGIWHQRRRELEPGATSDFTNVDLGGPSPARRTSAGVHHGRTASGFGGFLSALTGSAAPSSGVMSGAGSVGRSAESDGFLDDDGEMDFDEDAFRHAQQEDAKARLERVKEVKRALQNWHGWRLDLVDLRRGGGGGVGEVFEV